MRFGVREGAADVGDGPPMDGLTVVGSSSDIGIFAHKDCRTSEQAPPTALLAPCSLREVGGDGWLPRACCDDKALTRCSILLSSFSN